MKIDDIFKRQLKPASDKPSKQLQRPATLEGDERSTKDLVVRDTDRSCDRGVQKARGSGGSGGPLSESTNKAGSGGQTATAPRAAKKQQPQQDVQPIDLCDDDDDSSSPAPASPHAAAPRASEQHEQRKELEEHSPELAPQQQQQQEPGQEQEAMDVDQQDGVDTLSTPAPGRSSPATAAGGTGAGQEPATPADAALVKEPSTVAASVPKSTGGKTTAETHLSPEQRKQLLEACQQELPLLEAELGLRPDLSAHLDGNKKALDLKQKVSLLAEGQALPLTQLSELISSTLSSSAGSQATQAATPAASQPAPEPEGQGTGADPAGGRAPDSAAQEAAGNSPEGASSGPSALVVRNLIQEVASRKSYGLQDGALANVDALEDATAAFHWCWELRTLTGLPKAVKQHADAARKHRKQVLERFKAATAYVQLAHSSAKLTKAAEGKLARAAAKLSKLAALEALQAQLQAAVNAAEQHCSTVKSKQAVSRLDKANKEEQAAVAKAHKAQQAEEEKAAKEAERVAKEAERAAKAAAKAAEAQEKARLKAEKDADREAKRQQKAQEAAIKAAEAEKKAAEAARKKQAAEAAKAGFGSTTGLHKAQNVFKSFFGLPAQRPPTPSGGDTSQGQGSQMEGGSHKELPKEVARMWVLASGPTDEQLCEQEALEQQLPYFSSTTGATADAQQVPQLLAAAKQHWRALHKQHKRVWGLPPSWARRPGVAEDPDHVQRAAAALYGEGVDIARLRCWRRKLIKHHDSVRPPFYGSMPRSSSADVRGRSPFGKDVALDYGEESDQDWEEEPEGESLSVCEEGDEEGADEGDEDEEGFVVGDGYLSDDEGMRELDEEGGLESQLGGAAAAAAVVGCGNGSSDSSHTALAHLEAVLDHARTKGRHVVLVNNCPAMQWEPTTQLPPSILSCLKGTLMRTDISAAPPAPADLPHIFGATAATAAAGSGSPGAGAADGSGPHAAAAAAAGATGADAAAGGAGASGRGRPASVFLDALLPVLVKLVHNSSLTLEQLTKQFVQEQADAGVKVAKARVKDKIREISTMRKVGKAPLYTVKSEVLQGLEQAGCTAGGAAAAEVAAAADRPDGDAGLEEMQIDDDGAAATGSAEVVQQQQQQEAGKKRPASAEPAQQQQQQQGPSASCPPAKKQKHTPAGGIQRFFSSTKAPKPQQQHGVSPLAAVEAAGQEQPQQQGHNQQQQHGTPPSTPKHKLPGVPSLLHSELQGSAGAAGGGEGAGAAAAAAGVVGGGGGGGAGADRSGALPMLTPPSDVGAEDRPSKGRHSPVPFRLNSLGAGHDAAAAGSAEAGTAGAAPAADGTAEPPPKKQCKGQDISLLFKRRQQQQQQQQRQRQQQQQERPGAGGAAQAGWGGLLGGSASHAGPAAGGAAGSHKPSRLGGPGCVGGPGGSSISPPQLPEDGSAPGSNFWKQLAHWVVAVKEPSAADVEAAFEVFTEQRLRDAIHAMPQLMLSAMVKTLGSNSQSLLMRSACARCISNAVQCLVLLEQQQQQQAQAPASSLSPQQQQQQPAAMRDCAARTPPAPRAGSAGPGPGHTPSPVRRALSAAASPSPSGSPRSAPVGASFEELCAEPGLLPNLQSCLNPERAVEAAREARATAGASALGPEAAEQAEELAKNAARTVSRLLLVGLPVPAAARLLDLHECSGVTAAAAAQLRLRVASVGNWRGALRAPLRQSADMHRICFVLIANWALLSDPAACSQAIANKRLASGLLSVVASKGGSTDKWAIQKWCLLVLSALLSDATFREWALPWEVPLQQMGPMSPGAEMCGVLEALAALLVTGLNRPKPGLSEPDSADRALLDHCLQLSSLFMDVLRSHKQSSQLLSPQHEELIEFHLGGVGSGEQAGRCSLQEALQGVATQSEWQDAAVRAQQLLAGSSDAQVDAADV